MSSKIKESVIRRLKRVFSSKVALAAAINEVLTADKYPAYLAGIVVGGHVERELMIWAVKRGGLWN
jgi:hypothetical protein